jgi:hypothetical protein
MNNIVKNAWQPNFANIDPIEDDYAKSWRDAMDWARMEIDHNTLKSEFIKWVNDEETVVHLQSLPSWHFMTAGRVALLVNKGAIPPAEYTIWLQNKLGELMAIIPTVDTTKDEGAEEQLSVKKQRVLDYVSIYCFVEAILRKHRDDKETIEELVTERLRKVNPNRQLLKKLYLHFKESLADAMAERDNPLVAETVEPLIVAVNVIAGFSGNAKIAGSGAKADLKSQRAAANVNYKTIDSATNTASVSPAMIPGTSMAVIYNTKDRKAMVYVAKSDEKLSVKNSKIIGYDDATSFSKTLRKPKAILPSLRDAATTKRIQLILDQYVKGKNHTVNGRISKDMVIVKVFK